MNSSESWRVVIVNTAAKDIASLPNIYYERIANAIDAITVNPFSGDTLKLHGNQNLWRRRVGDYRIIFEAVLSRRIVFIYEITRRTSKTY